MENLQGIKVIVMWPCWEHNHIFFNINYNMGSNFLNFIIFSLCFSYYCWLEGSKVADNSILVKFDLYHIVLTSGPHKSALPHPHPCQNYLLDHTLCLSHVSMPQGIIITFKKPLWLTSNGQLLCSSFHLINSSTASHLTNTSVSGEQKIPHAGQGLYEVWRRVDSCHLNVRMNRGPQVVIWGGQ